jgi:hypothetical protein
MSNLELVIYQPKCEGEFNVYDLQDNLWVMKPYGLSVNVVRGESWQLHNAEFAELTDETTFTVYTVTPRTVKNPHKVGTFTFAKIMEMVAERQMRAHG